MIDARPDATFRRHGSGLFVPDALSREREVWTQDEWKLIDRVTKLLTARGVKFQLACADPRCQGEKLQLLNDKGMEQTLRCGHKDRVFTRRW